VAPLAIARFARRQLLIPQLGPIAMWSVVYVAISVIWYAGWPSADSSQELRDRLLAVCFLGLAAFVLIDAESRRVAGLATVGVVLLMVVVNGLQLTNPEWFVMTVVTRSSGLYLNANQCAAALVLGMVIGWPFVRKGLRPFFLLLVGAAVAVTFSRSGAVGWLAAGAVLLTFEARTVKPRRLVLCGVGVVTVVVMLMNVATAAGIIDIANLDEDQFDRITFLQTLTASDESSLARREIAAGAWQMVAESPLAGNGLASTLRGETQSTHNMFLYYMADHGFLGALVLPGLVLCAFIGRAKGTDGSHWAFCAFTLWYAFFSHNILTERYHLIAFAFFAMGGSAYARSAVGARATRLAIRRRKAPALVLTGSAIEGRV
jgi:O-antigen ligase